MNLNIISLFIFISINLYSQKFPVTFKIKGVYDQCSACQVKTRSTWTLLNPEKYESLLEEAIENKIFSTRTYMERVSWYFSEPDYDKPCEISRSGRHIWQPREVIERDQFSSSEYNQFKDKGNKKIQEEQKLEENKQIEKQNKENSERERRINDAQNSIESSLNDHYLESAKKEINDFLLLELNSSKRDYANGKLKEINYFLNEAPEKLNKYREYSNYLGAKIYIENILSNNFYDRIILRKSIDNMLEDLYIKTEDALKTENLDLAKKHLKDQSYFIEGKSSILNLNTYYYKIVSNKVSLLEKENLHLEKIQSAKIRSLSNDEYNLIGIYNNYGGQSKDLKDILYLLPSRKFIYNKYENAKIKYEYVGTWSLELTSNEKKLLFFPEYEKIDDIKINSFTKSDQFIKFFNSKIEYNNNNIMNFQFKLMDNKFSSGTSFKRIESLAKIKGLETLINYPKLLDNNNVLAYWPFNNELSNWDNKYVILENNANQIRYSYNINEEDNSCLKLKDNLLSVKEFDFESQSFTVSFLYNVKKYSKSKIVQFGDESNGWHIFLDDNEIKYNEYRKGKCVTVSSSYIENDNEWSLLSLVRNYEQGTITLFVNNDPVIFEKKKLFKINLKNQLAIGQGYEGKLDDIIFWNSSLSLNEVKLFYPNYSSNPNEVLNEYIKLKPKTVVTIGSLIEQSKCLDINGQIWMKENLSVTSFRNGDRIPEAKTAAEWEKAGENKQPAWCYYNNDPKNGVKYGILYNWYAVSDPRSLAPDGWHVPTDIEWTILGNSLGGKDIAGMKMKNTTLWEDNFNGTDEVGFSGVPSGTRDHGGNFGNLGNSCFMWSSSEAKTWGAFIRILSLKKELYRGDFGSMKQDGYSVRCIKD